MPSNRFIPRNKYMFKIAIRTLELNKTAVNYFRKKAPSYMFDHLTVSSESLKRGLTLKKYLSAE